MTKKILAIVLGLAVVFSSGPVFAGFTSGNADYQVSLLSGCMIDTSSTGTYFGAYAIGDPDLTGVGAGLVQINCAPGTNYWWGIDVGSHFAATMNMFNGTDTVPYSLYESGAPIGNNGLQTMDPAFVVTNADTGRGPYVGTGLWQNYNMTADVSVSAGPTPGVYSDTVVVSVAWP
jgi:spore coat protein U-like protein